jgi:hypothetical protein
LLLIGVPYLIRRISQKTADYKRKPATAWRAGGGSGSISDNDNHNHDGRAGLSRIEIDAHGLVQRKEISLIAAKTDGGGCSVPQQGHERDLNGLHSVQSITELHDADRALDRGTRLDGTPDEYTAAAS